MNVVLCILKKSDLTKFKTKLLDLKREILEIETASSGSKKPVALDQSSVGRVTRIDAIQQQQMAVESSRRRTETMLKIEAALRRIESDEFGICVKCGDDIASARLDIDPTFVKCVNCS